MKTILTHSGTTLEIDENLTLWYNYLEKVKKNTIKQKREKLSENENATK